MNNVKVTAKVYNLDKPTRNGRVYTKAALEEAQKEFTNIENMLGVFTYV